MSAERYRMRKCIRHFIRFVVILFLIINSILGLGELAIGLLFNFLRNHPEGPDGFTDVNVPIVRSISYYEHQEWEFERLLAMNSDDSSLSLERIRYQEKRLKMIKDCSKFTSRDVSRGFLQDQCMQLDQKSWKKNYFCSVVENPEAFLEAYAPMARLFMSCAFLYLGSVPLILLSLIWKTQSSRILKIYTVVQIIPITTASYMLYLLWYTYKYELCGIDYLYDKFDGLNGRMKLTHLFTLLVFLKMGLRILECLINVWFLYEIHVQEQRKDYGIKKRKKRAGAGAMKRVDSLPQAEINDELLVKYTESEEDISIISTQSIATIIPSRKSVSVGHTTKIKSHFNFSAIDSSKPSVNTVHF